MIRRASTFLALVLLGAACAPGETIGEHPCPTSGTPATYTNFAGTFFVAYCDKCHGQPEQLRQGAPPDVRFDSLSDVRSHAARIFDRAAGSNDSMPPGPDDPPADERETLADWLACGSPR